MCVLSSFFFFSPSTPAPHFFSLRALAFISRMYITFARIKLCSRGCTRSILFRTMWQIQCACHGIAWPITRRFVWFVRQAIFIEDCSDDSNTTSKYMGLSKINRMNHHHHHHKDINTFTTHIFFLFCHSPNPHFVNVFLFPLICHIKYIIC